MPAANLGPAMILMGLYVLFLALFTAIGTAIGYACERAYPGSGSLVAVAIFLAAAWFAWTVSVRVSERFWPTPTQPSA